MIDFGEKLKKILTDKNITPYRLSQLSGIRQSTLSAILNGVNKPSGKTLEKICFALDISMAEFDDNELEAIPGNYTANNTDLPSMETVLLALDKAAVTEEEKRAAAIIKAMSKDEQQASFLKVMEKYKSLSAEHQEALAKLINSLPSSHK